MFDFLFVPPVITFNVHDPEYFLTFGVFLIVSVIVSQLGARVRTQVEVAQQREQQTAALYTLTQATAFAQDTNQILDAAVKQINSVFGTEAFVLLPAANQKLQIPTALELNPSAIHAVVEFRKRNSTMFSKNFTARVAMAMPRERGWVSRFAKALSKRITA